MEGQSRGTYVRGDQLSGCLSKVVKNNLNPSWEPFRLSLHSLCSCDVHRPLKVRAPQARAAC